MTSSGSGGNITMTGGNITGANVITATYFSGDGSNITNVPVATEIAYGTSNVIVTGMGGNVAIGTNNSMIWNFDTAGNLTLPNGTTVVMPGYPGVGEGANTGSLVDTQVWLANPAGTTYVGFDGNISVQLGINENSVFLDAAGNLTASGNIIATGTVSATNIAPEASFSIKFANFSAVAGQRYGVNTFDGTITATLPASPTTGTAILFADAGGFYSTNNLVINPGTNTIMDAAGTMTVSTDNQTVGLFWSGTTWRTYNAG